MPSTVLSCVAAPCTPTPNWRLPLMTLQAWSHALIPLARAPPIWFCAAAWITATPAWPLGTLIAPVAPTPMLLPATMLFNVPLPARRTPKLLPPMTLQAPAQADDTPRSPPMVFCVAPPATATPAQPESGSGPPLGTLIAPVALTPI